MPKILVVDDEISLRTLYQSELARDGYDVVLAQDGNDALSKLDSEKPDLVVLDIRMPGIDGLETMARLLGRNNQLPVILNTAYPSYRESFLSWSADAYVVKSSDLSELKTRIREVLQERSVSVGRNPAS